MTTLAASKMRIPSATLESVTERGQRVRIRRKGASAVYLISAQDLELLEKLEDRYWGELGQASLDRFRASGRKPIPWEKTKAELGL